MRFPEHPSVGLPLQAGDVAEFKRPARWPVHLLAFALAAVMRAGIGAIIAWRIMGG